MTIDAVVIESLLAKDMNKSFVVLAQSRRRFCLFTGISASWRLCVNIRKYYLDNVKLCKGYFALLHFVGMCEFRSAK